MAIADSAMRRREICFSFSELLIKLLGEKKLLWRRRGKNLGCQEHSSSLQALSCITSKIQVWLNDNEVLYYILHRKLFQLLQQFPHTVTPAGERIRHKVKLGRCSHIHHHIDAVSGGVRQPLKSVFAAATTENEEQCVRFTWKIA